LKPVTDYEVHKLLDKLRAELSEDFDPQTSLRARDVDATIHEPFDTTSFDDPAAT
jgi:hypothetical protein